MPSIRLSRSDRKAIAAALKADIDAFCVSLYTDEYRDHLGASIIGEKCARYLVYAYRWMHREHFDGRMLRLFNRGHVTEPRFIEWLRGIGCNVSDFDSSSKLDETGAHSQHRMHSVDGHYGGSLDGLMQLPVKYGPLPEMLLEMKTYNDKTFKQLLKAETVILAKPKHYSQMCAYGEAYELDYALYIALNKNDDDLYLEVVELDREFGKTLVSKASGIINAETLPNLIAATSAYVDCKYCGMAGICHHGQPVDVNCRSCKFSHPIENAEWFCEHWKAIIPHDAIPDACGDWQEFGK